MGCSAAASSRLTSEGWWSRTGSNRRHPACKAGALPAELRPLMVKLVGLGGLEPPTSRLSSARSNQLSYKPFGKSAISRMAQPRKAACPNSDRRGSCRASFEAQILSHSRRKRNVDGRYCQSLKALTPSALFYSSVNRYGQAPEGSSLERR